MEFEVDRLNMELIASILSSSDLASVLENAEEMIGNNDTLKGKYIVNLSEDRVSALIDSLSDYLVSNGVDEFGELNSLGYRLENIIDILVLNR